jgi:hypothetical protein
MGETRTESVRVKPRFKREKSALPPVAVNSKGPEWGLLESLSEKDGARGGSRTPTSAMDTRSLVWRVYQFRHPSQALSF